MIVSLFDVTSDKIDVGTEIHWGHKDGIPTWTPDHRNVDDGNMPFGP